MLEPGWVNNTTSTALESIKVDVWSDIACPWCYIGKKKFEVTPANGSPQPPDRHQEPADSESEPRPGSPSDP
ncbi:DsbA family protein [Actinoplanes sp. TRM 88003]|uniref:DsbA family protein n=1 Tax=Paractinoplanes aksuensis TaxID=2939490 RepID=A0ABT1DQ88_9ACTN|nr:DsbA family protein [Actinoplanes aksuensis]MCO8273008.1 DsbA family protein [Actinoplanes aksuensis]